MRFPEQPAGGYLAAAFAMRPELPASLFGAEELARLRAVAKLDELDVITDFRTAGLRLLAGLEVLVTGWGAPVIGAAELNLMPRLRAVIHAGGTVKGHVLPEVWERGILVTTAADANARPVAEFTLAAILLAGKDVAALAAGYARDPAFSASGYAAAAGYSGARGIGNYGRIVGIVGASRIGRRVIDLLGQFDFRVLVHDPHLAADDPLPRHAERTGLADLFTRSSIVSIHAPLLPETTGLVGSRLLALMRPGAVLINTARGAIVDHDALAEAVHAGGLRAILDVTEPEPLPADHPLRGLPGVILTPHVAGSLGNEIRRLGESATREVELLAAGQPPMYPVGEESLITMALTA